MQAAPAWPEAPGATVVHFVPSAEMRPATIWSVSSAPSRFTDIRTVSPGA